MTGWITYGYWPEDTDEICVMEVEYNWSGMFENPEITVTGAAHHDGRELRGKELDEFISRHEESICDAIYNQWEEERP